MDLQDFRAEEAERIDNARLEIRVEMAREKKRRLQVEAKKSLFVVCVSQRNIKDLEDGTEHYEGSISAELIVHNKRQINNALCIKSLSESAEEELVTFTSDELARLADLRTKERICEETMAQDRLVNSWITTREKCQTELSDENSSLSNSDWLKRYKELISSNERLTEAGLITQECAVISSDIEKRRAFIKESM